MATLKYGNGGIKYDYATVQSGTFTKITSSQVVIATNDGWTITGNGSFSISNGSITGGTISSYAIARPGGELYASMTGLSLSVSTYNNYASRGDGLGLFKYVLSGNDTIAGGSGNDTFLSTSGSDFYSGGAGKDIVYYSGPRASYTVSKSTTSTAMTVGKSNTFAVDGLASDIERVHFADNKAIAFDIEGAAGQAYRLYQAAFDRKPDLTGLGVWINQLDIGQSLEWVSAQFQDSAEFKLRYGTTVSNEQFVTLLYQNVLHRAPDSGGLAAWKGALDAAAQTRAQVLAGFSESTENKIALIGVIQNGMEFTSVA